MAAYYDTAKKNNWAPAEELFCPSILRDIEKARADHEKIPAEVAAMAEKCKQLGYSRK
jgi:hypothetical protein